MTARPGLDPSVQHALDASLVGLQAGVASALQTASEAQTALANLTAVVPQYVSASRLTVDQITAQFPPSSALRGKLALVSDLFGAIDGTLKCGFDGTRYFWAPNGTSDYAVPMSVASNVTLFALKSATIVPLSGIIGVGSTRTITLSLDGAYPGARKRIATQGVTSLLGSLSVLSGVSGLLNLALNQVYDVAVDYSSGSPQWIRI